MPSSPTSVPVCKAILLCQKTIVESQTKSVSLISVLDGFVVGANLQAASAEAFCQITEANGRYHFTVQIEDLSEGSIIATADGPVVEVTDPLARANVIIPIPSMEFPHPGTYDFVILANGSELDRQQFGVIQRQG